MTRPDPLDHFHHLMPPQHFEREVSRPGANLDQMLVGDDDLAQRHDQPIVLSAIYDARHAAEVAPDDGIDNVNWQVRAVRQEGRFGVERLHNFLPGSRIDDTTTGRGRGSGQYSSLAQTNNPVIFRIAGGINQ